METNSNPVLRVAPAAPADALAYFTGLMTYSTDVSDVYAASQADDSGFTLVDTRGDAAWFQGRVPGAVHLPTDDIASRASELVPADKPVVVYCWGPGCNGAYRAAVAFASIGYQVKYMMGGFEYWVREGLPVETAAGVERGKPDPLTAPSSGVSCDC